MSGRERRSPRRRSRPCRPRPPRAASSRRVSSTPARPSVPAWAAVVEGGADRPARRLRAGRGRARRTEPSAATSPPGSPSRERRAMPFVRGADQGPTCSGSIEKSSTPSTSQSTGSAPAYRTAAAVATNGEARDDHLVARAQAGGEQRQVQRRRFRSRPQPRAARRRIRRTPSRSARSADPSSASRSRCNRAPPGRPPPAPSRPRAAPPRLIACTSTRIASTTRSTCSLVMWPNRGSVTSVWLASSVRGSEVPPAKSR